MVDSGETRERGAAKAGMDPKTARKYLEDRHLPSERREPRRYRTRKDPFVAVWPEVEAQLELNPTLEARTLFEWVQAEHPGEFQDGQLRTFQRGVRRWRATCGPAKEVFFAQVHEPGRLSASDFTCMNELEVTINGQPFDHMLYHFVLTYSNWEHVTLCYSESFEALSGGLQAALWALGKVPARHRTDQLSAAVNQIGGPDPRDAFRRRYLDLLEHYGIAPEKIQAGHANENGDVEQSHGVLKRRLDQALMLRGRRDFESVDSYMSFVQRMVDRLNQGRRERLSDELAVMEALPARPVAASRRIDVRVDRGSLIRVCKNVYSVDSRLIGERVTVLVRANELEIWYGQKQLDTLPRLRGEGKHLINYRHIIDWLVRKPGAFDGYRYREDLFPTTRFRVAYDALNAASHGAGAKPYLELLELAARESESAVDDALGHLIQREQPITPEAVTALVRQQLDPRPHTAVEVAAPDLSEYDALMRDAMEVAA